MVVSGAPVKENDHADRVCDMALDMVEAITDLKDRSTGRSAGKCSKRECNYDLSRINFPVTNISLVLSFSVTRCAVFK